MHASWSSFLVTRATPFLLPPLPSQLFVRLKRRAFVLVVVPTSWNIYRLWSLVNIHISNFQEACQLYPNKVHILTKFINSHLRATRSSNRERSRRSFINRRVLSVFLFLPGIRSPEHAAVSSELSKVDGINENRIADESFVVRQRSARKCNISS